MAGGPLLEAPFLAMPVGGILVLGPQIDQKFQEQGVLRHLSTGVAA